MADPPRCGAGARGAAGRPLDRCPVQVALPPWCSAQWIVAWDRSQSAARDELPAAARRPTPRSTRPRARPARSAAARAGDSTAAFVAAAPRPGARAGDESPSKLPRSCGRRLRRSSRLTVDRARASRRAISRTASRRPCGAVPGTPSVAGLRGRCRASVPAATVPIPDFSALRSDPGMLRIRWSRPLTVRAIRRFVCRWHDCAGRRAAPPHSRVPAGHQLHDDCASALPTQVVAVRHFDVGVGADLDGD